MPRHQPTRRRRTPVRRLLGGTVAVSVGFLVGVTRVPVPTVIAVPPRAERAAASWPTADGRGGTHHSPLREITASTVTHLERAWIHRTGDVSTHRDGRAGTDFEATPVMVDGLLYVSTPYSRVLALDAGTGREVWAFDPGLDRSDTVHTMVTSRGVSYWRDPVRPAGARCLRRIFLASYDARLFALDAASGRPCGEFGERGMVDLGTGVARVEGRRGHYKQTAPPTVIGNVVAVGSSIYDNRSADAPSGIVRGFDARTGELRWSFEPLAGVGGAGEGGGFVPAGAGNAWATLTADPERDLLFVPTGSPSPDHYGGLRPGPNRYANSLVALRGSTGEVVWHFQTVHHDLWDYDLPTPPALITVERDGRDVPAVVQATKTGHLFFLHRETGEPLFPVKEQPVPASDVPGESTWPTQPVPVLPRPLSRQGLEPADAWGLTPFDRAACRARIERLRHDGVFAPPSLRGTVQMPGALGGMEWGGVGWDPGAGLVVVNMNHLATVATLVPREDMDSLRAAAPGKFALGAQSRTPYGVRREALLSPLGLPCSPPPWGTLAAVDTRTGAVRWEVPLGTVRDLSRVPPPRAWGSPNLGGPLVTGGLVFIAASMDRRIRAFDLHSGEQVWEDELPASAQATPMTYRARPGGRQYIVVAAGGHDALGSTLGDHVVAWSLPPSVAGLVAREGGS